MIGVFKKNTRILGPEKKPLPNRVPIRKSIMIASSSLNCLIHERIKCCACSVNDNHDTLNTIAISSFIIIRLVLVLNIS